MGGQGTAGAKFQKLGQDLSDSGRVPKVGVGDAGEVGGLRTQVAARVDEGLKFLAGLAVPPDYRAKLNDFVIPGGEPRGFQVESDKFAVQGEVLRAVYGGEGVQVVVEVSLESVENYNGFAGTGHLGLFGGVHGVGVRLEAAVVGDGNGPVAPAGGGLDGIARIGQGVHVGHAGV